MNSNRTAWLLSAAIATSSVLIMAGCATQRVKDTENLLQAAGFKIKLADTPERMEHLQKLPQQKVVPHKIDGKVKYIYADAKVCECIYIGDEKANQAYRKMSYNQQIEEQREATASLYQMGPGWDVWGPW